MAEKTIKATIKEIPLVWMGPLFHRAIIGKLFCYLELDSVDARSITIRNRVKPGKRDFIFKIDYDEAFVTRKQVLKVIRKVRASISRMKVKP